VTQNDPHGAAGEGATGSTVPGNPEPDWRRIRGAIDLLGVLAYALLVAFFRLAEDAALAESLADKAEKSHKQRVSQHAEQVDRAKDPAAIRLRIRGPGGAPGGRARRVILRHERSVTSPCAQEPACLTPPAHSMLLDS